MTTKTDYKTSGLIFLGFFVLIIVGNLMLASAFDFPDILRKSPAERFTLFQANQGTIVLAYYMMSVTSILQVYMAAAMYQITKKGRMVDLFAVTSGVLSGVFQMLGFFRWVILMPMLSNAYNIKETASETIFFLEKFANTYMGMTVGEHLGTLFTGLWLTALGVVLVQNNAFDKRLAWLGLISGIALFIQSYESVNASALSFLGDISIALWALYVVWALIMAIMLYQKKDETSLQTVHWGVWLFGAVLYAANVIPSFL
jgi:hypothetical protein